MPRRILVSLAFGLVVMNVVGTAQAVPSGQFLVNINDSREQFFSDSQQSITFWDAQALAGGPLFSVHIPGEFFNNPAGELSDAFNKDEPEAIAVDPATGDVYVLVYDSGSTPGTTENPGTDFADIEGDLDLYKINTQTVLNHWMSTIEGKDARSVAGVSGPTPNVPFGSTVTSSTLQDYVTYGVGPRDEFGQFDPRPNGAAIGRQSNTLVLPGAIEKIGQIKRNDDGNSSQGFFPYLFDFIDSDTLFMVDDASEFVANGPGNAAKDHEYRIIQRVSTSPNMLTSPDTDGNFGDGGFNMPPSGNSGPGDPTYPTESWRSQRAGLVNLDFALGTSAGDYDNDGEVTNLDYLKWKSTFGSTLELAADGNGDNRIDAADYTVWRNHLGQVGATPSGHSEPTSTAFFADPVSGVQGVWIAESDGGGDDIAFRVINDPLTPANNNTYRPFQVGPGPSFPTSFSLDDNPFVNPTSNDGKAVKVFVDQDTGALIIVESGFGDVDDPADPEMDGDPNDPKIGVIRREVQAYDNGVGQIQFGAWSEKVFLNPALEGDDDNFQERGQWSAYDSVHDLVYFFDPDGGDPNEVQDGVGADYNIFDVDIHVLDLNTGLTTSYLNVDDAVQLFSGDAFGDEVEFFSLDLGGILNGSSSLAVPEPTGMALVVIGLAIAATSRQRFGQHMHA
jgi:Dockerin type I domain